MIPDDFLWQHLRGLPYFRALLRAVEARFYQDILLAEPILDLGCGDGHFASPMPPTRPLSGLIRGGGRSPKRTRRAGYIAPIEVTVGGATVFTLPVERFARFGAQPEGAVSTVQEAGMKLVIAIVPQEHSDAILDALMDAEYRATRISTTGGFFRRGNATLLIGVEANQVDAVLKRIEDACASVAEQSKPPTSCETVFVLNTERHMRI